jgi:hypothetical protein
MRGFAVYIFCFLLGWFASIFVAEPEMQIEQYPIEIQGVEVHKKHTNQCEEIAFY